MSHHPSRPSTALEPISSYELDGLVRRVASGDRRAFASLYEILSPSALEAIRQRVSDPADAACVLRATFVEVGRLARHHLEVGTARGWIAAVASRRAAERTASTDGIRRPRLLADLALAHDARIDCELAGLLGTCAGGAGWREDA